MASITNIVSKSHLNTRVDLRKLARDNVNIIFNPRKFTGAVWRHRRISGTLLVFPNGTLLHLGKPRTTPRIAIRQYARIMQKQGHPVHKIQTVSEISKSMVYKAPGRLNLTTLARHFGVDYTPEIMNAVLINKEGVHYTCFHTGTVNITGVHSVDVVLATLSEINLYNQHVPISIEQ